MRAECRGKACFGFAEAKPAVAAEQQLKYAPAPPGGLRRASARSKSFLQKRPVVDTAGRWFYGVGKLKISFIPNRSLDFGEIARLCHAACFSPSRRRSGLRRGVARNRMRTEAGKMPESLISPIRNGHGVSNDRFGFMGGRLCNGIIRGYRPRRTLAMLSGSMPQSA